MIAIIWRYEVRDEHHADFEATYGPAGEWAKLFARNAGFRGTELLRKGDGAYLTIDVWRSRQDFDDFLTQHRAAYDAQDALTEAWTTSERRLGEFDVLE